ncbi:MAG: patatin-like phospholipase family protein [Acidobacteriota bacterium]|nr:patatin-like phospholipase family protein [Acidobacteriota bacterium]
MTQEAAGKQWTATEKFKWIKKWFAFHQEHRDKAIEDFCHHENDAVTAMELQSWLITYYRKGDRVFEDRHTNYQKFAAAMAHLVEGQSLASISKNLGVPEEEVAAWSKRALENGEQALAHKYAFRILSMNGGGALSIVTLIMMRRLLEQLPDCLEHVNIIAGVSAGGINGLAMALTPKGKLLRTIELLIRFWSEVAGPMKPETYLNAITGNAPLWTRRHYYAALRKLLKNVVKGTGLDKKNVSDIMISDVQEVREELMVVVPSFSLKRKYARNPFKYFSFLHRPPSVMRELVTPYLKGGQAWADLENLIEKLREHLLAIQKYKWHVTINENYQGFMTVLHAIDQTMKDINSKFKEGCSWGPALHISNSAIFPVHEVLLPFMMGIDVEDNPVLDIMMRTSAAPIAYPVFQGHLDGGIYAADPSPLGVGLARMISDRMGFLFKPKVNIELFSFGIGMGNSYLDVPNPFMGWRQWLLDPENPLILMDVLLGGTYSSPTVELGLDDEDYYYLNAYSDLLENMGSTVAPDIEKLSRIGNRAWVGDAVEWLKVREWNNPTKH